MLNVGAMFYAVWFLGMVLGVEAAIQPSWTKVALVEIPGDRCLRLEVDGTRLLCVSESTRIDGEFTSFSEVRLKAGSAEKRLILELRDTSSICRGRVQSVSRFFSFESKDLDGDGCLDPAILIRAGKFKRQGLPEGVCSPEPIGTSIYEIGFRNAIHGLEAYEPSYPVLQRLQSLNAIVAE